MLELHTKPLKAGEWSEPALRVMRERYLVRDESGRQETPEEMCWRVSTAIAQAEVRWGKSPREVEEITQRFYDLMLERLFLPNSPTLMNAGKGNGLQYSACYVLPVRDSMEEIFEAIKRAALIHQSGGGTGFAFSQLRPKDSLVRSTGGKASGPVSFLRVFNAATEAVKQGGTRRGANMGILRVDHPDILEFIDCKLDGGITNFNISVTATDRFMQALAHDEEYELIAPHTSEVVGGLPARDVFQRIVEAAWRTGDPGLIFIDRINSSPANPTPELGLIEATNPCGEQPLLPNEACNLGSINVSRFVVPSGLDWARLEKTVRLCVRFLDDVIEVNPYPLPEIDAAVKGNRRIGLGVMGFADLLFELNIPYDSEGALRLAEELMAFINRVGHDESENLAAERGPFPSWPCSIYKNRRPLRNSTVTTIAPTGSIGIIAGCSTGIEPVFALAYSHIVGDRHLQFINPIFEGAARERGFYSPELMAEVVQRGRVLGVVGVPEEVQRVFVTAHEIAPEWHVRMQAAFQKHTDNGVSKTINLPNSASVDDIGRAYLTAYELGCLGITVFRDGSKAEQVLHVGTARKPATGGQAPVLVEAAVQPRPRALTGVTYRMGTPLGSAFITINSDEQGQPFEVFVNVGKAGSDVAALAEALGRTISLIFRLPSPLPPKERAKELIDQLSRIGGGRSLGYGPNKILSLPDALAHVLAEHLGLIEGRSQEGEQLALPLEEPPRVAADLCPDCGQATLIHIEGCEKCYSCGFSEC